MEINAQAVIDRLTRKIATLEGEKAVLEVQVEALQEENVNLSAQVPRDTEAKSDPIEGDVIVG